MKILAYKYELIILIFLLFLILFIDITLETFGKEIIFFEDFESGNLESWEILGVSIYCRPEYTDNTRCEDWCNIKTNSSCRVSGMGVIIVNDTPSGKHAVAIGHYAGWERINPDSKIVLRKNISIPKDGDTNISFYIKLDGDDRFFEQIVMILDQNSNDHSDLWQVAIHRDSSPFHKNWTRQSFSLNSYKGKNITFIFRSRYILSHVAQWSETSMMLVDDIKVINYKFRNTTAS